MIKIFIDSDFLVALNDEDDSLNKKATALLERVRQIESSSYLSTNILLEALTIISQSVGKKYAIDLLDELRSSRYEIVNPDDDLVSRAEDIFGEIKSKNVSYSDCVSFAVMRAYAIEWVFSFDADFKKQGFKRIGIEGFPKGGK